MQGAKVFAVITTVTSPPADDEDDDDMPRDISGQVAVPMGVVIGLHGGVDFVDIEHKSVRCAQNINAQKNQTNFIQGTSRTGS